MYSSLGMATAITTKLLCSTVIVLSEARAKRVTSCDLANCHAYAESGVLPTGIPR
ncbi:hypothetical protein PF005_g33477 [Phytophthora fragariae]|uniref:Uncharacterized protein n=2 Tax=Phytophthora TaxID=4783 RepID=A0A6A3PBM5_9STRA|nr:hypothetical protein PF003_g14117 [Phytophthora fragariae]KAE9013581.1 hypothetical protein PR002_g14462 [Phytophthora rubi]KAE8916351.1 hypothetical protein PF009_g33326 [Phytophthora fragariae]KAE8956714.1 hypothetical protein PF011_g31385 [Phytophthora fragariae]KAE9018247.1 hypothetical protein PR001_g14189 [Phytophthora rubi]